jgi:hypothetical protein
MEKLYDITCGGNPLEDVDLHVAYPWQGSLSSLCVWFLSPLAINDGFNKK